MRSFYLDASALAKRSTAEPGTILLNHLFATVSLDRLHVLNVGIGEVASILVREKNAGLISAAALAQALVNFRSEIVSPAIPHKSEVSTALVVSALPFIETHSLNATDAILLRSALDIAVELRPPAMTSC